jgi:hypothetical protein
MDDADGGVKCAARADPADALEADVLDAPAPEAADAGCAGALVAADRTEWAGAPDPAPAGPVAALSPPEQPAIDNASALAVSNQTPCA